jgi:hypothetical protein
MQHNFLGELQKVPESQDIFYERSYPVNVITNVPNLQTFFFLGFRQSKAPFDLKKKSPTLF